jgi:hypothetical protein
MASAEQLKSMHLYANIMEEVKFRIQAINHTLAGQTSLLFPFANEFGFLQLRMLCELIALGCLVAHGDIQATKTSKYQKAYAADDIMKMMEGLNPDFFPIPVVETSSGGGHHHLEARTGNDWLSKAELISLNGKCGDVLHRGSIKKLISKTPPVQHRFPEVQQWAQKVANLLSHHLIAVSGGEELMICLLQNPLDAGRAQVVRAKREGSPLLSEAASPAPQNK